MASKTSYKSISTGATVSGELVTQTSNAYQVAVEGKVRLLLKEEWQPIQLTPTKAGGGFGDLFGGLFK